MMWRLWQRLRQPTLVRRMVLAQMLLLTLLWSLAVGFVMIDGSQEAMVSNRSMMQAIISVTDNLAEQPVRQKESLRLIDEAVREAYMLGEVEEVAPIMLVWQHGKLVYRSPYAPEGIRSAGPDQMEIVYIKGQAWRSSTLTHHGTRVTVLEAGGPWQFFVTLNSHGYYLLPLLISLPFLLLPAWLSIRLAMRPWRAVAQEVAARGPHDLRPLGSRPPHGELASLVDNINALLQRVQDSAERERSFITDATHELRTPLAAMRVNVEALQAQADDPRQQELLNGILSSNQRAARLVGQLLQLTRNEAQLEARGALSPQALDELLQDRLAAMAGLAQQRGIELELQAPFAVRVTGQRESLVSLVDNLLENALKYSPRGSCVTVSLHLEHGQAVLHVSDQGPGIAPELHGRVFDRFFRAPQQEQAGSGLGLAIVASVVRQHGGTIALFRASGGQGLLVAVRLPLATA